MHLFLAQAAEEESSGGLIDVVPGLMIWTLICFALTEAVVFYGLIGGLLAYVLV